MGPPAHSGEGAAARYNDIVPSPSCASSPWPSSATTPRPSSVRSVLPCSSPLPEARAEAPSLSNDVGGRGFSHSRPSS